MDLSNSLWIVGKFCSKTSFLFKKLPWSNRSFFKPFRVEYRGCSDLFLSVQWCGLNDSETNLFSFVFQQGLLYRACRCNPYPYRHTFKPVFQETRNLDAAPRFSRHSRRKSVYSTASSARSASGREKGCSC